jgi:hypothetical protein
MNERDRLDARRVDLIDAHESVVSMREAAEGIEDEALASLRRVEAQIAQADEDDGA